jgi:hypothetical protein
MFLFIFLNIYDQSVFNLSAGTLSLADIVEYLKLGDGDGMLLYIPECCWTEYL